MNGAFFAVHSGLEREGPGEPADVARAAEVLGLARDARILDAGCGPGADIAALLEAAPEGHVTARDTHAPFVARVSEAWAGDPRVAAEVASMTEPGGPFDLIWSAGALYNLGLRDGLGALRELVAEGGAIAFSHPCLFEPDPNFDPAEMWGDEPVGTKSDIADAVAATGWESLETWRLSDAAWERYYQPLEARCDALEREASDDLLAAIGASRAEIAAWRRWRRQTGYLLTVARAA
ncbi:class I SAM-dependent methyltransferase [Pseudoroseicyclus tamaricis]|uniref:Class I SAM-dependent methyltransferase n=1 Tax=Pseudoroseicyclus tamaricis TaxID=2705421 RepID=A0A6B2JS36_9RHOB|nr:class I SAM-dependent methyltransferase [Pseudoroseicyclus tamaricis]NDV00795.1 class I SAM-dependent methyltransferase [Pseudoroseicyclus tamaricis]